jgi:hypothetical protein
VKALAELFERVEAETPYGGRAVTYEPVGYAWLKTGARRRRERNGPEGSRMVETVTAETRSDPRVSVGRMLRFGGADWRIAGAESVGGRGLLTLERMR